jgi:hypothetical protein
VLLKNVIFSGKKGEKNGGVAVGLVIGGARHTLVDSGLGKHRIIYLESPAPQSRDKLDFPPNRSLVTGAIKIKAGHIVGAAAAGLLWPGPPGPTGGKSNHVKHQYTLYTLNLARLLGAL